ncbi:MAG: T9SS type A sorting domain-containing protein, partial [Balneolaceae bacterium]
GGPGDGTDDWIWYFDDFDIVTTKYSVKTPLTFEDGVDANYFNGQRGSEIEVVANPYASGINTSDNTGKFIKGDQRDFAGFNFLLADPIQIQENEDRVIKMKVWSPRDSVEVRLELQSDGQGNKALFDTVWTAEEWVELEFDLSEGNTGVDYIRIFQTYDWDGGPGDGTADWIWYFDDFNLETLIKTYEVELPLTFEDGVDANYFNGQRGSQIEVVANPDISGLNTSDNTGKFIKGDEQPFAGFNFDLANPINTVEDEDRVIRMKVWSPRDSVEVRLELKSDGEGNKALFDTVWTAEEWLELEFDLSGVDPEVEYIRIFTTYDWDGGPGDGTDNWIWYFDDFNIVPGIDVGTEVEEIPAQFSLSQNYPNPFNPTTNIQFELAASSQVTLTIFNVLGQKVAVLLDNNKMNAGTHTAVFDANMLSSGVYFYRLEAGSFVQQKIMTLIK